MHKATAVVVFTAAWLTTIVVAVHKNLFRRYCTHISMCICWTMYYKMNTLTTVARDKCVARWQKKAESAHMYNIYVYTIYVYVWYIEIYGRTFTISTWNIKYGCVCLKWINSWKHALLVVSVYLCTCGWNCWVSRVPLALPKCIRLCTALFLSPTQCAQTSNRPHPMSW